MAIAFSLLATSRTTLPEDTFDRIQAIAHQFAFGDRATGEIFEFTQDEDPDAEPTPAMTVSLYPIGGEIFIALETPRSIRFDARTSASGPGFHQRAIAFVRAVAAELSLTIQSNDESSDESNYFESGSREGLERAMLDWLSAVGKAVKENMAEHADATSAISMSLDYHFPSPPAPLHTPMGPRDTSWIDTAIATPDRCIDHFPWWDEELTARTLAQTARALMWTECRWMEPETEDEAAQHAMLNDLLVRAHELDPELELPWREWLELIELNDGELELHDGLETTIRKHANAAAESAAVPVTGYRRADVVRRLYGKSITIPGSFLEYEDDESWVAHRADRFIRVSALAPADQHGNPAPLEPLAEEFAKGHAERIPENAHTLSPINDPDRRGEAFWFANDDPNDAPFILQGYLVFEGTYIFMTIGFADEANADWAESVWRSVK